MKIAAVVVHYHAGELTRRALTEVRRQADADDRRCDLLVIDHGGDQADRQALAELSGALGARRIEAENDGFAAGVNRAFAGLDADAVLLLNPDVLLFEGALRALSNALVRGVGVAGPRFYWDRERRFLLPPTERRGRWPALLDALAQRSEGWATVARRRWRAHARRHWRATAPLQSHDLSGGCLLVSRAAWDRVGPFDERFRLYFEENDWLLRARARGVEASYVPEAAALHEVGRSSAREPRAQAWFEESAGIFRRLHYGAGWAALVERVAARTRAAAARDNERLLRLPPFALPAAATARGEGWIEASPSVLGYPAAGEHLGSDALGSSWELPPRAREAVAAERWAFRWVSEGGEEGPPCGPPRA
jgi:N-acetylglucosaminyl-diphospho-decaprenol L-rhamnosyltransferase